MAVAGNGQNARVADQATAANIARVITTPRGGSSMTISGGLGGDTGAATATGALATPATAAAAAATPAASGVPASTPQSITAPIASAATPPSMTMQAGSAQSIDAMKGAAASANGASYTSLSGRIDALLAQDSPLMQRAATLGRQQVNRRGLGNSSMSVGAAQQAMVDAAAPIATAEAREAYEREALQKQIDSSEKIAAGNNATTMSAAQLQAETSVKLADQDAALREKLAGIERDTSLTLADKNIAANMALTEYKSDREATLAELERDTRLTINTSTIAQADRQLASNETQAGLDRTNRTELTDRQIASNEREGQAGRETQLTVAERGIEANRALAEFDAGLRTSLQQAEIAAEERRTDRTIAADERRTDAQIAAQEESDDKQIAAQAANTDRTIQATAASDAARLAASGQQQIGVAIQEAANTASTAIAQIMANPKLKAADRNAAIASVEARYTSSMNYIQNLYGVGLSNTTPRTATATGGLGGGG